MYISVKLLNEKNTSLKSYQYIYRHNYCRIIITSLVLLDPQILSANNGFSYFGALAKTVIAYSWPF
jgi:hypothetical protein